MRCFQAAHTTLLSFVFLLARKGLIHKKERAEVILLHIRCRDNCKNTFCCYMYFVSNCLSSLHATAVEQQGFLPDQHKSIDEYLRYIHTPMNRSFQTLQGEPLHQRRYQRVRSGQPTKLRTRHHIHAHFAKATAGALRIAASQKPISCNCRSEYP